MLAILSAAAVLAAASGYVPGKPVVLACSIPARPAVGAPVAPPTDRIFRVGLGAFQEWDPGTRAFGRNLCNAFACVKTEGRNEGSFGSASVSYTVGVAANGAAYWRALGASGLGAKEGPCRIIIAPKP